MIISKGQFGALTYEVREAQGEWAERGATCEVITSLDGGAYMKDRFFYQIKEEAQRAIDAFPYWNEDLTHYPNANLEVL